MRAYALTSDPAVRRERRRWAWTEIGPLLIAALLVALAVFFGARPLVAQQPAQPVAAGSANATSRAIQATTWPSPHRSLWFSDRRTFQTGEVISIVIDEFTLVAAGSSNSAQDRRQSEGLLTIFPSSRNGLGIRGRDESDQSGLATRDDRLQTEISVRVVEIDASGTLRLEGRKLITIDQHEQQFVFRGWARPQDVLPHNVIEGWRVADLELLYVSNGELQKPKKGLIAGLLGILF